MRLINKDVHILPSAEIWWHVIEPKPIDLPGHAALVDPGCDRHPTLGRPVVLRDHPGADRLQDRTFMVVEKPGRRYVMDPVHHDPAGRLVPVTALVQDVGARIPVDDHLNARYAVAETRSAPTGPPP